MWLREISCIHYLPEGSQILCITHGWVQTACPSYVHIEALSCTCTHLDGGKERVSD